MIDTQSMFKGRTPNAARLADFGFSHSDSGFCTECGILDGQFKMSVFISDAGEVSVKVIDAENHTEYTPAYVPGACGEFVGAVIYACEEQLRLIAQNCFDREAFKSKQARQIIEYACCKYGDRLEFLWDKFPDNAVLRRKDTGKWYAAFLTVERAKLGLDGTGRAEIIDLRALPEEVLAALDGRTFLPAYHMNKKHWYTILLNGSVPTQDICVRLNSSYLLAK